MSPPLSAERQSGADQISMAARQVVMRVIIFVFRLAGFIRLFKGYSLK